MAVPIALAMRWASFSPRPGQNQARTPCPRRRPGPCRPCRSSRRRAGPELLKSSANRAARPWDADREDDVLLPRPGIGCPVGRARPDGLRVADHVFVVHQVGNPRDRGRREGQRLEQPGFGARRRRHGHAVGVVEVVGEPDRDAALRRSGEGGEDDLRQRIGKPHVVDRDVERAASPRSRSRRVRAQCPRQAGRRR